MHSTKKTIDKLIEICQNIEPSYSSVLLYNENECRTKNGDMIYYIIKLGQGSKYYNYIGKEGDLVICDEDAIQSEIGIDGKWFDIARINKVIQYKKED